MKSLTILISPLRAFDLVSGYGFVHDFLLTKVISIGTTRQGQFE